MYIYLLILYFVLRKYYFKYCIVYIYILSTTLHIYCVYTCFLTLIIFIVNTFIYFLYMYTYPFFIILFSTHICIYLSMFSYSIIYMHFLFYGLKLYMHIHFYIIVFIVIIVIWCLFIYSCTLVPFLNVSSIYLFVCFVYVIASSFHFAYCIIVTHFALLTLSYSLLFCQALIPSIKRKIFLNKAIFRVWKIEKTCPNVLGFDFSFD